MIEIKGDYWKIAHNYRVLVCTTNQMTDSNGNLVMGAGIAKGFKERFDFLPAEWGKRIREKVTGLPHAPVFVSRNRKVATYNQWLVSLPTKLDWRNASPIDLVEKSCRQLHYITGVMNWETVLMTRPGCGLGGLKWDDVKKTISFLDDRFTVIDLAA